jgi:ribosomal protein L11 methyltransferase
MTPSESYWWYITLETKAGDDEMLVSLAEVCGSIGAEIQDLPQSVRSRLFFRSDRDLAHWLKQVKDVLESWPGVSVVDMGRVDNRPWHREWKEAFPPLPIGRGLVVLAPWHSGSEPVGRLPLYIHPKSAFGTGYHESTQIALEFLERHLEKGMTVADIGTGSGILAIAAAKLGALRVVARDLDPAVIVEVRENRALNGLSEKEIDVDEGDLLKGLQGPFDLLTANILFDPLVQMLPDLARVLRPGAKALFAGLALKDRQPFREALAGQGLSLVEEKTKGEWWGVVAQIPA